MPAGHLRMLGKVPNCFVIANECDAILDLQCSQDILRVCGLHTLIDNDAGTRFGRKIHPLPVANPVQEEASPRVHAFRRLLGDAT